MLTLRQLKQLGLEFTEREFRHLAHAVDTDGSGEISYKEFTNLFSHKAGRQSSSSASAAAAGSHGAGDPETPEKDASVRPKAASFDFTHLTRCVPAPRLRTFASVKCQVVTDKL